MGQLDRAYLKKPFKFDFGATSDSDSEPCVEPELSTTDSVELKAFTPPN